MNGRHQAIYCFVVLCALVGDEDDVNVPFIKIEIKRVTQTDDGAPNREP